MLILSTAFLPPIAHFHLIQKYSSYQIDGKEHFVKQSQRNRALIYGANGTLALTVPLKKFSHQDKTEDIKISYDENWQNNHWRSIESAYRNSAYFEFYEDDFRAFYEAKQGDSLIDFNNKLEQLILSLLKIEANQGYTANYVAQKPDWRILLSPKNKEIIENGRFPNYQQVFSDQFKFKPNLSIIDLLFNLGPASTEYLREVNLNK